MKRPIRVEPTHKPKIPITAGNTGGTGTGNLNNVKIAPTAAPVNVHKIISLIEVFHLHKYDFLF